MNKRKRALMGQNGKAVQNQYIPSDIIATNATNDTV